MKTQCFDVAILGAGPAGSVLARELRSKGYSVALLERERFPRYGIGESLPPSVELLLRRLGILGAHETLDFPRTTGFYSAWGTDELRFTPHTASGRSRGLQAERARFDAILLNAARETGTRVFESCHILNLDNDKAGWKLELREADGHPQFCKARFLCDATGQARFLVHKKQLAVQAIGEQIALVGYWRTKSHNEDANNNLVESLSQGWFYTAQVGTGIYVGGFVTDRNLWPVNLRSNADDICREALSRTQHARKRLRGARLQGDVRIFATRPSLVPECCGTDWLLVGDAASTFDPLCSQGVQKAISSALAAVPVVHTVLTHPERSEACQSFYRDREKAGFTAHLKRRREYYQLEKRWAGLPFWEARSRDATFRSTPLPREHAELALAAPLRLSAGTEITNRPVVQNGLIEELPVVVSTGIERGLRFLHGICIPDLARFLPAQPTLPELSEHYRRAHADIPPQAVQAAVHELWRLGVLEAAS